VDTVDGGGAVLTFHLNPSFKGVDYHVQNNVAAYTDPASAQPGVGFGLFINVTGVTEGDGSARISVLYTVIPVGDGAILTSVLGAPAGCVNHPSNPSSCAAVATITAGHAGTGYHNSGDFVFLPPCNATWTVTASGGVVQTITPNNFAQGSGCTTGNGQATTVSPSGGTGLELDVSAVGAGWHVNDHFSVSGGNNDATGHVTAITTDGNVSTYVIDNPGTGYSAGQVAIFDTTRGLAISSRIVITAVD